MFNYIDDNGPQTATDKTRHLEEIQLPAMAIAKRRHPEKGLVSQEKQ